ncbi:MAG: hypothetical protein QGH43_11730 [Arenicellales bacterium]|nr:hypothetical protein [Arenicellales bacterium]
MAATLKGVSCVAKGQGVKTAGMTVLHEQATVGCEAAPADI